MAQHEQTKCVLGECSLPQLSEAPLQCCGNCDSGVSGECGTHPLAMFTPKHSSREPLELHKCL